MPVQLDVLTRNAKLDAIETAFGASPHLLLITGTQPVNCATLDPGTVLATIILPANWMNDASGGAKTMHGAWSTTAVASGTIGHFRIVDAVGTPRMQGSVTGTGDGGDATITSTSTSPGQVVTVTSFTLTEGNA